MPLYATEVHTVSHTLSVSFVVLLLSIIESFPYKGMKFLPLQLKDDGFFQDVE